MEQEIFMQSTTSKTETNLVPKNEGTVGWQEMEHSEEDRDASEHGRYGFTITLDQLIHTFTCDIVGTWRQHERQENANQRPL